MVEGPGDRVLSQGGEGLCMARKVSDLGKNSKQYPEAGGGPFNLLQRPGLSHFDSGP